VPARVAAWVGTFSKRAELKWRPYDAPLPLFACSWSPAVEVATKPYSNRRLFYLFGGSSPPRERWNHVGRQLGKFPKVDITDIFTDSQTI